MNLDRERREVVNESGFHHADGTRRRRERGNGVVFYLFARYVSEIRLDVNGFLAKEQARQIHRMAAQIDQGTPRHSSRL